MLERGHFSFVFDIIFVQFLAIFRIFQCFFWHEFEVIFCIVSL